MSPLRIRLVSLLVVVAMIGVVSCARDTPCTPETCRGGPVTVYFSSTDCSGAGTMYDYFDDAPSTFGTCQQEALTSSHRIDVMSEYVVYFEVNNPSCALDLSNTTYYIQQDYFGVCRPRNNQGRHAKDGHVATSSWMFLANANATYTSPQPAPVVNLNYPNIYVDQRTTQCDTPTNCTQANGDEPTFISTFTAPGTCNPSTSYGTYNNSYDGTCYRVGDLFYADVRCIDAHGVVNRYYVGNGCQTIFSVEYERNVCVAGSNTRTYTCSATPVGLPTFSPSTPSTPSTVPTSPATSTLPSLLLLLASFIAFLF